MIYKFKSGKIKFYVVAILVCFLGTTGTQAQIIDRAQYGATIKIACIGNSITYGSTIENRDSLSYPAQLGRLLGNGFEVRNFGVSGRTLLSKGDRPYIKEQAFTNAKAFLPDFVLIKLGTNDTKPHNWAHKSDFKTDYLSLIKEFQQLPGKPIVVLLKAVPAFQVRWGISDSIIRHELNPMIEDIAAEEGLSFIDLYQPFIGKVELFPDSIHPNANGAALMAKTIFDALIPKE